LPVSRSDGASGGWSKLWELIIDVTQQVFCISD
jgi:hypothetical protein